MNNLHKIEYKLIFESPFIISTSVSDAGNYDAVSILSDKVPYIPNSSIRGRIKATIRQHCIENSDPKNSNSWNMYNICNAQKSGNDKDKYCNHSSICPLCRIFGIPGSIITRGYDFSSAYIEKKYKDLFKEIYKNNPESTYHKRARNKINPELRRSEEDALFTMGLADISVPFIGNIIEMPFHKDYTQREFDKELILLGMRLITEIGGNRNRGLGRCRFEQNHEDWFTIINGHIIKWKEYINKAKGSINENV